MIDVLMGHLVIISDQSKATSYLAEEMDWEKLKPISEDKGTIDKMLNETSMVEAYSNRNRFAAMLINNNKSIQSFVIGIDPENEHKITNRIVSQEGKQLNPSKNGLFLTENIARTLNVTKGSKIMLFTDNKDGEPTNQEFNVEGIAVLEGLDKYEMDYVYIHNDTAKELLNYSKSTITEYVVRVKDGSNLNKVKNEIQDKLDQGKMKANVYTWKELGGLPVSIINVMKYIFIITMVICMVIIFLFITMATVILVVDRKKEIGSLRAIGIHKSDIILLFLMESGILNIIFSGLGILTGSILTLIVGNTTGTPLVSDMMEFVFGGKHMYPKLVWYNPVLTFVLFFTISILGALYPAFKASRLEPIDAIEK
jgi:ABC-type lipoprotein release transport system permease subunit